jgi:hypothetical protein
MRMLPVASNSLPTSVTPFALHSEARDIRTSSNPIFRAVARGRDAANLAASLGERDAARNSQTMVRERERASARERERAGHAQ